MRNWLHVSLLLGLICGLPLRAVRAQEDPPPEAALGEQSSSVSEAKPEIFYLRDKRGEPIFVPNFSLEEWERLVQIARNLSNPQRPAYVIEQMLVSGTAREDQVELTVEFAINRRPDESFAQDAWVKVPLRLNRTTLHRPPEYSGDGEFFVTFEENQDGYTCWMRAKSGTTHTVTLHVLAAISKSGDQSSFQLMLPAPLTSSFQLDVPESMAEGSLVTELDEVGRPLPFESRPSGGGRFIAKKSGVRGQITVSWQPTTAQDEPRSAQLDVVGRITVSVDERVREVRSQADFRVRSFGRPLDRFRLRLPPGFRLRETPSAQYSINPIPSSEDESKNGQLVEVVLDRATPEETSVLILADLPINSNDSDSTLSVNDLIDRPTTFQPARFTVLGAVRHLGVIDFKVRGDWKLQWDEHPNVSRTDSPPAQFDGSETTASFRYSSQPCDLDVAIRQKATRIQIEPSYELAIDARQVRMLATFAGTISGAQAHPLALRLGGWTIQSLRFTDYPSPVPVDLNEVDPLVVPTPPDAQSAGTFTMQLEASRALSPDVVSGTRPLQVTIPRIEAFNPARAEVVVIPARVIVVPAVNVALTPRERDMQALVSDTDVAGDGAASQNARQFRYRDRGVAEPASFVSDVKVQPRAIAIEVASTVEVTRSYTETQQLLAYDVQHESIDALVLSVPQSMIDGNRVNLRVSLDDQPLVPQITASPQAGRAEITVNLPEPVLGAFQLAVNHQRATNPEFTTEQPQDIDVPLVLPAADPGSGGYTTIISNKLSVTYDEGLQVKAREGTWSMRQSTNGTAGRLALTSASDADHATLQVTLSPNRSGSTTLHQAWIQTWLAGDRRRDRAVFRIRTSESQLNVTLPESADLDESRVAIAVDRQAVENKQVSPSGEITIVLGQREDDWQQEHVVEVWYSIEGVRPVEGTMRLQAATIDADDRTERCFWQLVFPSNELLVRGDSQFTPELAWRWQNFGWQRQPLREQQDLEDWIGASRQDPLPLATNRYVFTSFGVPGQLEVVTLARSWILLIASGVTLAVGLLLIYVPVLRHPACLLTAGVVLLGLAMVRPELSVVLAQAAVLGIVLVVVARLLRHAVSRGSAEPAVHGRSQFADSKTTEVQYPRGEGSSRVTTGSAPVAIQMRTAEPKS